MILGATELLVIVALLAIVVVGVILIARRGREDAEADVWARRHGLALTPASRPWVDDYLRVGRNLRQLGGVGGLVAAASVTAATGLDLEVSGLVWLLLGYLAGALWAELALTRLPAGTRRTASLTTRRLGDYLPAWMRGMQLAAPLLALALGALSTLAYRWHRTWELTRLDVAGSGLATTSAHHTDELLHSGARVAAVLAPLIMVVVWAAQRYLVGRPQPMVEPSLVAADDALRSSSTHMLGAAGLAAVWLLIGGQFGYLFSTTVERSGPWTGLAGVGIIVSFAAAFLCFRWRNAPWQVRHAPLVEVPVVDPHATGATSGATGGPALTGAPVGTSAVAVEPPALVDAASEGPVWTMRRSPVPLAVVLIVLIGLAGWGLRTWGGINPDVTISDGAITTQGTGEVTAQFQLQNQARAAIVIDSVVSVPPSSPGGQAIPSVPDVQSIAASDPRRGNVHDVELPLDVPGGSLVRFELTMSPDAVSCPNGPIEIVPFDVEVTYRTESGRTVRETVPVTTDALLDCVPPLPSGPQPADPAAAEAAVRSAATIVYDPAAGAARLDLIDDPWGVADASAVIAAGPYADEVATTTATIGEVSFDRPDHAWFHYVLSVGFGTRTGEAVLVDGRWKVARATVCADLALANVTCPPLPR